MNKRKLTVRTPPRVDMSNAKKRLEEKRSALVAKKEEVHGNASRTATRELDISRKGTADVKGAGSGSKRKP